MSFSLISLLVHDQRSAVRDKMQRMLVNHSNRFELLQESFSMSSEQHTLVREEMEAHILRMLDDYKADIVITGERKSEIYLIQRSRTVMFM